MKPWAKSVTIAVVQVALVASLGGKLLYDRMTLPRAWALTAPYDPNLPIRGRYVRLQVAVDSVEPARPTEDRLPTPTPAPTPTQPGAQPQAVTLQVRDGRLLAVARQSSGRPGPSDLHLRLLPREGSSLSVLAQPLAFFIPEHVADPSIRPSDEQLWVEVTVPPRGPPRPIRLGVRKHGGPIIPLELG